MHLNFWEQILLGFVLVGAYFGYFIWREYQDAPKQKREDRDH